MIVVLLEFATLIRTVDSTSGNDSAAATFRSVSAPRHDLDVTLLTEN
jgi:hypothetical protein